MEKSTFEQLLLKTAFSFMACDGDIDPSEVDLIRTMANEKNMFGEIDVNEAMNRMVKEINELGGQFLRNFFTELTAAELTEPEQLQLVEVAIDTIYADNKVEYSEIKFFKIVKSKLTLDADDIMDHMAHIEDIEDFVEQDIISPSYIANLTEDYLGSFGTNQFDDIAGIADDIEKAKKAAKK